jgi:hypothetical protein
MSKSVAVTISAVLAVLATSSVAMAQGPAQGQGARRVQPGFIAEGVPKMPNPPGPAPKQDLSGAWVGPQNRVLGPYPPMTPAGEALSKSRKPYVGFQDLGGKEIPPANDPFSTCDPLGFPRNLLAQAISSRGGTLFGTAPNRIIINYDQQRVWREIWMDGRELPKKFDTKGAPDSRLYGTSVGHWDGDHTLVIDTTGFDERPWLDESGHPRSTMAHIQERYNRVDQYNIELTVTVDDPKFYTKPFQWLKANFYWMKDQTFEENFCIPSEGLEYRDTLAKPSGVTIENPQQ